MGHSLCSFILRQIPRRSPTHNAVYFTTTRLGGYKISLKKSRLTIRCGYLSTPFPIQRLSNEEGMYPARPSDQLDNPRFLE